MTLDAYMQFTLYSGELLESETHVNLLDISADPLGKGLKAGHLFDLQDYSFDLIQVLNIGSQSTGVGAGKVSFNPLRITRKVDRATPVLFQSACSGRPFKFVTLVHRKAAGGSAGAKIFIRFDFKLVAVKTQALAASDDYLTEVVTFEYGGLVVQYGPQQPNGMISAKGIISGGWNRVKNATDTEPDHAIL